MSLIHGLGRAEESSADVSGGLSRVGAGQATSSDRSHTDRSKPIQLSADLKSSFVNALDRSPKASTNGRGYQRGPRRWLLPKAVP